ncbi:2-oxo-4-hydroxy-4-carboxy-5-ureidoimidazoline decarboxylase [Actinocorallia sp. API 0066]|uniref:2-oxo-4-hydroxy-4-carboxy-5-ureidoimidazoline decarboxylase n=1 Tax=Actinocorallia sp. API 0066 TaxID=2896846 RepID=UPI001E50EFB4|nr:2-oxo-4-hydroxy-4-carboxy-5-ureidoimidazoline decarboxylase [Actinocorallia sp. API 0066]MCD0451515.1 2-oxo-4-hydroxy-4-carboxy-5-ureidoimidazoline decarboxylase [Actinocorallia sp. API 0066]
MTMAAFHGLPASEAEAALLACCAVPRWAREVTAGRPYPDVSALQEGAIGLLDALSWEEVLEALDAHPRIGERAAGASTEAAWSRQEQSAAADPEEDVKRALVAANVAYEERFGHVFLICATGRSAEEILKAARARLANPPDAERRAVRRELAAIVRLRLEKLVAP